MQVLVVYSGVGSLAHFSEDSLSSSNQENEFESETGEDTDKFAYLEQKLERPVNTGAYDKCC